LSAPSFAATKRIGFVLNADKFLNWHYAQQALETFNEIGRSFRDEFNASLLRHATDVFEPGETPKLVRDRIKTNIPLQHFGPVIHTDKHQFKYQDYNIQLSASVTICVSTKVGILDQDPINSKSKLWVTAIISSSDDKIPQRDICDDQLADICRKVDVIAGACVPHFCEIYNSLISLTIGQNVNISASQDRLSSFIFQTQDRKFRDVLEKINKRACTLSGAKTSKSFEIMDKIFDGKTSEYFLKIGRSALAAPPENISVDSFIASDRFDARAFIVETKSITKDGEQEIIDWRILGTTSGEEPHHSALDDPNESAAALGLHPAHSLSNELANLMGAQF
jgi:hypothetical protein